MDTATSAVAVAPMAPPRQEAGANEFLLMGADFAEMGLADSERCLRDARARILRRPDLLAKFDPTRIDVALDHLADWLAPGGLIQRIRWACGVGTDDATDTTREGR